MPDSLTPAERSIRMGLVKSKNTKPELLVRSLVHKLGYRFRLHRKDVPGHPDLVFSKRKKVIFVHGCFWHRHPDPACKLTRWPKTRLQFWQAKFEANRQRDLKVQEALRAAGWSFLEIWECQVANTQTLKGEIMLFLGDTH
jgi:DNA mismatch endonuclease (patch repair protein)